jgi:hypothetical protein
MKMRFSKFLIVFLFAVKIFAQQDTTASSFDVYVIDSFITPELPHKFVLSFSTGDSCTSEILINKKSLNVSKIFTDSHRLEIELDKLKLDSASFSYSIVAKNKKGTKVTTESYLVALPKGLVITPEQDVGLFSICLGGIVFAIPSPTYVFANGVHHWSLSKEIPLINFYSIGYNYPSGYVGVEYSYIFDSEKKNFLRFGYKQIIQVPAIKYISPGIDAFTDFKGYNGMCVEFSTGLFQIQNIFTLYLRYRYNFQLIKGGEDFHEISIGLYSNFFSLNL